MTDVQRAAGPAGVWFQKKSPRCPVKRELFRRFRIVRVIGFKFPAASGFRYVEQDDAMIDGHRRKFHQMKNGQTILFERGDQSSSGARLVRPGKGKSHAPVAPQKIRAPRAAALGFQKCFLRPAELAQTDEAGNDNSFFRRARLARIACQDGANEPPVNFIGRGILICGKPRVIKKLPRHAREGKTAVGVIRFWLAPAKSHFARGRVTVIGPDELIGKGKTVAHEIEAAWRAGSFLRNLVWHQIRWHD